MLTPGEAELLIEQDRQIMDLINVDDFAPGDIGKVQSSPRATPTDAKTKET